MVLKLAGVAQFHQEAAHQVGASVFVAVNGHAVACGAALAFVLDTSVIEEKLEYMLHTICLFHITELSY